MLKSNDDVVSM